MKQKILGFLALFTSTGTLLCCALPALIAALAGGAAVGAFVSTFPWLIVLSQHKTWLFLVAGALLVLNGILIFQPKGALACRLTGGKGCDVASQFSRVLFWISSVLFGLGFLFAYALVPLLEFFS